MENPMKNYVAILKGTKKQGTNDVKISIKANNMGQAFNIIYQYFEKGQYESFFPDYFNVFEYTSLKGKYFVPRTSIKKNKMRTQSHINNLFDLIEY